MNHGLLWSQSKVLVNNFYYLEEMPQKSPFHKIYFSDNIEFTVPNRGNQRETLLQSRWTQHTLKDFTVHVIQYSIRCEYTKCQELDVTSCSSSPFYHSISNLSMFRVCGCLLWFPIIITLPLVSACQTCWLSTRGYFPNNILYRVVSSLTCHPQQKLREQEALSRYCYPRICCVGSRGDKRGFSENACKHN